MGKNRERWTREERQELNRQYDEAIGEYAQAMSDLGVDPKDVSGMVIKLSSERGLITRNDMLLFIQATKAASQAAKKRRRN